MRKTGFKVLYPCALFTQVNHITYRHGLTLETSKLIAPVFAMELLRLGK